MIRYHSKVIQIRAEDSPNVKYALMQIAAGLTPTNDEIVPGVIRYENGAKGYVYRRKHWDPLRQKVGLDAEFHLGAEVKMFPVEWLARAERMADRLAGVELRRPKALGVDSAQGGDNTAWAGIDEKGLISMLSKRTPDTAVIPDTTMQLIREHGIRAENVAFDQGGGGQNNADTIRRRGHDVRTIFFGAKAQVTPKRSVTLFQEKKDVFEDRTAYKNMRALMYWDLRALLDPLGDPNDDVEGHAAHRKDHRKTFALPRWLLNHKTEGRATLREQMKAIPIDQNEEGQLYIIPKHKRDDKDTRKTLTQIIGSSPDELDALVLAVHALLHKPPRPSAGAR